MKQSKISKLVAYQDSDLLLSGIAVVFGVRLLLEKVWRKDSALYIILRVRMDYFELKKARSSRYLLDAS